MLRLLDGRKWIIIATLVVVSIVAIPAASAQAAPKAHSSAYLSMYRGKSKIRSELRKLKRNGNYADAWLGRCWRRSYGSVVCMTTVVTYGEIYCDSKIGARNYGYGIYADFPGKGHCHY
jgi:hypothetical protein